jgi:hypothetical protein
MGLPVDECMRRRCVVVRMDGNSAAETQCMSNRVPHRLDAQASTLRAKFWLSRILGQSIQPEKYE